MGGDLPARSGCRRLADARPLRRLGLAIALVALAATGCGGRGMGQVKGRVTVGGVPVQGGTIMFYPADGPGAVGQIAPDGTYTVSTHKPGDGAVVGSHKVAIHATNVGPGTLQEPKTLEDELRGSAANSGGKILVPGKVTWLVPEKYSTPEQSPLTAEVKPGRNTIDFDIPKP
jgi:hypothetical protein